MSMSISRGWNSTLTDPSAIRIEKPRKTGLTMVIDKGMGITQFKDMLTISAEHLDFIKLGFGTSALYPSQILMKKLEYAHQHNIIIYPGGTFFEVAYAQGKYSEYLQSLREFGFDTLEISDGSISISPSERKNAIETAMDLNFRVLTECGKKTNGSRLAVNEIIETLHRDLEHGAAYMLVEGRESGKNVGIYQANGQLEDDFIEEILANHEAPLERIIWEAPLKEQQVDLIRYFGANVNLGNIAADELYSLEALRRGLRADTFYLTQ